MNIDDFLEGWVVLTDFFYEISKTAIGCNKRKLEMQLSEISEGDIIWLKATAADVFDCLSAGKDYVVKKDRSGDFYVSCACDFGRVFLCEYNIKHFECSHIC